MLAQNWIWPKLHSLKGLLVINTAMTNKHTEKPREQSPSLLFLFFKAMNNLTVDMAQMINDPEVEIG